MEGPKSKQEPRDPSRGTGSPGIRVPAKDEGSSSEIPPPSDDAARIPFSNAVDPDATLVDTDATLVDLNRPTSTSASARPRKLPDLFVSAAVLQIGAVLGGRYEILQLLGEGGMGAVYKARDRELDRFVALKVIRPELAANPQILARFKQELLLAHQVTHKNVIRIYDLGEAEGVKFITMEYIEGADLRSLLLDQGKFTPEAAVEVIRQVCRALQAAHTVNVIHRDLKPGNIMRDSQGRILVMDFGLARSVESEGMTRTGALVGTMEYMSPEQALGSELDQRSDIFSLGLIFFELLTGKMPYKADTAVASLLKRNQERAASAADLDPAIPKGLSDVVAKCLERDLKQRYQNIQEILTDLDAWQGNRPVTASLSKIVDRPAGRVLPWKGIAIGVTAALLVIGGISLRNKLFRHGQTMVARGPEQSLAILPFRNASGDAQLDWLGSTLAYILSTDVGQSSQLRTVSPDRLHQVLSDLRITPNDPMDANAVGRVAENSSADTLVWGQYTKFGDQIRIDATLHDLKHDYRKMLMAEAANEKDIPGAVDRLAAAIRQNLSVSPDAIKELQASSFKPSTMSLVALKEYNQGVESTRDGKNLEALKSFQGATKDDPQFALAFSKLADTYSRLGYDNEAEQNARKAKELSEGLPAAEKTLIAADYFRIAKDYPIALEAYLNLAKASPDNPEVQAALAGIYEESGDIPKAREAYQKLLKTNPKDMAMLLATGRVEIMSGNSEASLAPLNQAYSLAVAADNREQKAAILNALGIAYSGLNKPEDALQHYQESLKIKRALGQKKGIADSLNQIAQTYDGMGKSADALKNYQEALQIYKNIGARQETGAVLINLGQFHDDRGKYDEALRLFKESLQIQRDVHNQNDEATCLNNIGNTYLFKSDYEDARIYFEQALELREKINVPGDIATTLHNLAEVYTKSGQYDQALSRYLRALELYRKTGDKRGTGTEAYGMGTVFEYQGRYGSAVSSKKQALQDFRDAQEHSFWMSEALGGYGNALSKAGGFDEGSKSLDEGLKVARDLKNDAQVAQILDWQGDNLFYRGDAKAARGLYEQALKAAAKATDRSLQLTSKLNLAKAEIANGQSQSALAALKGVAGDADALGLKYLAVECAIDEADARMQLKDYAHAQQLLDRAVLQSERLGVRPLLLKAHFLLGKMYRQKGSAADATQNYRQALTVLDAQKKEQGAGKIMDRADLKAINGESDRWVREHP